MGWKEAYRSSSSNVPAVGRGIFHQTSLLKAPSNLSLNTSREGTATASPGYLYQCLTTLLVKNFFLMSNINLPYFSLKPLLLLLSLQALVKSPYHAFLWAPFRYWKAAIRPPRSLLCSRLNNPNSFSLST